MSFKISGTIYWSHFKEVVDNDFFKSEVERVKKIGVKVKSSKSKKSDWFQGECSWNFEVRGSWRNLFCCWKDEFGMWHTRWYTSNFVNSEKNEPRDIPGWKAKATMLKAFTDRTGITMKKAFGLVDSIQYSFLVPKAPIYINKKFAFTTLEDVSKIDISSCYPFNACGKLPDAHTAKRLSGTHKPTKEYPFAFYLKSHHCAEYKRFDTHNWLKYPIWIRDNLLYCETSRAPIYNNIKAEDDVTVLMKASNYELTPEFETFYAKKEKTRDTYERAMAKAIMNMFIGCLHPHSDAYNPVNAYYHLAAICLGRAAQFELDTAFKLREQGAIILLLMVDGIIYFDKIQDFGNPKGVKIFGQYEREISRQYFRMADTYNRYIFADENGNILDKKVQGIHDGKLKLEKLVDIDQYAAKELL